MKDYITHIDLKYDKEQLLKESKQLSYVDFKSGAAKGNYGNGFFVHTNTWKFGYLKKPEENFVKENFSETYRLKKLFESIFNISKINLLEWAFIKQEKNTELPLHIDQKTYCGINIILSENYAPIFFKDIGYIDYSCALINTKKLHSVQPHTEERLILKFSSHYLPYEFLRERLLKYKGKK